MDIELPRSALFHMKTRVYLKWIFNFPRSALFHMKTRVYLKYFVNDCLIRACISCPCRPFVKALKFA